MNKIQKFDSIKFNQIVDFSQYGLSKISNPNGKYQIIGMSNIDNGKINMLNKSFIDLTHDEYIKYKINEGDLLFNRTNSIDLVGKSALATSNLNAVFASYIVRFKLSSKVNSKYINYYFSFAWTKGIFKTIASPGVSQYNINPNNLLRYFTLILPPLHIQNYIVNILSVWDQAIEKTQRLINAREKLKKGLMQKLLTGKLRLPWLNEKWNRYKMAEIFSRITRKNDKNNDNVLTISAQDGFVKQEHFFTKRIASKILTNYYLVKSGEFAYNKSYSNGYPLGAIKRLNNHSFGVVTTLYICFSIKDLKTYSTDFFELYFEAGMLNSQLEKIANEGGRAHGLLNVTPTDFFNMKVFIQAVDLI